MSEEIENKETSFAVVITPEFGEDGKWTGIVGCHMEEEVNHDLSDEELIQIRAVCGMLATSLTIMEEDEDFLTYVRDAFMALSDEKAKEFLDAIEENEKPNFTKEGNVITLSFDTKTHGSA